MLREVVAAGDSQHQLVLVNWLRSQYRIMREIRSQKPNVYSACVKSLNLLWSCKTVQGNMNVGVAIGIGPQDFHDSSMLRAVNGGYGTYGQAADLSFVRLNGDARCLIDRK